MDNFNFQDQSDVNILWREARALYKLSGTKGAKKAENIREGYELISKALELDDNNFACHKWMSVLLDAKSELDGLKARVSELENVKKHMIKAVELNPEDPTSWHLLGNFAFGKLRFNSKKCISINQSVDYVFIKYFGRMYFKKNSEKNIF